MVKDFFQFNVLHGRHLCGMVIGNCKNELSESVINLSENLIVLTVGDDNANRNSTLNFINLKNKNQLKFLRVDRYIKWISKVEILYNYVKSNYNDLPKYILYLDGLDTLILKDITNPSEYLDFYKCKILFNIENQYAGTGYEAPNKQYLHDFYNSHYQSFLQKNIIKYGNKLPYGLNAGVFLGEKDYILNILEECYSYMSGNIENGFPYGCTDDQYVFRYLHNKHYDIISADIFNIFSFWGGSMSVNDHPGYEMFKIGYTKQFLKNYLDKKNNI